MSINEIQIWEQLNNAHTNQPDISWLGEIYSLELSRELRIAIAEQLGVRSQQGWGTIKYLYQKFGVQPELIHAAGLSHQPEARDWLLTMLTEQEELNIFILQALACWGASLPNDLLKKILVQPEAAKRLAGLTLLEFKAYQLSDKVLLDLTQELLHDFRDPVVIATLNILKRRDGIEICKTIAEVAETGSHATTHSAIMALGSIGTKHSQKVLKKLKNKLLPGKTLSLVNKQIQNQLRFDKN